MLSSLLDINAKSMNGENIRLRTLLETWNIFKCPKEFTALKINSWNRHFTKWRKWCRFIDFFRIVLPTTTKGHLKMLVFTPICISCHRVYWQCGFFFRFAVSRALKVMWLRICLLSKFQNKKHTHPSCYTISLLFAENTRNSRYWVNNIRDKRGRWWKK